MRAIIASEAPVLTGVLERYFSQRDCPIACHSVNPAQLPATGDDGCAVVIVDCGGQLAGKPLALPVFQQWVDDSVAAGLPLLMLSDSRVFSTVGSQRYRERDLASPQTPEGEYLLQCERYLAERSEHHIIVRTGPLIAASGSNLLVYLVQQMLAGGDVLAATEPRFAPTSVADLVRVVAAIFDQIDCSAQCWGVYHYHSSDTATLYEFAEAVLAAASQYWNLGGSVHLRAEAARGGQYPMLSCQKVRDTFGVQQMQWRKAIPELLKQMQAGGLK